MKAIYFMRIDYIKVKQQIYFVPLFVIIALALWGSGFSILAPASYMMFTASIFATAPFGTCRRGDAGFLVLLPSTAAHRVLGRFLYGMSFVGIAVVVFIGIFMADYQMTERKIEAWTVVACLFFLAFSILIMALEFLILYLMGERMAPQLLGVVRVAPAMVFYFVVMHIMDDKEVMGDISTMYDMGGGLMQMGMVAVAAALVIWVVAAIICVKVTEKRDYV